MNFIKRIAAIVVVTLAVAGTALPAHAADTVPWPGEPTTDCQVLELEIATLEYDNARLKGTLEEERDEHADALRIRDEREWATRQAHDAEVNELSAAIGDAQVAARGAAQTIADQDLRIIRLQAKVKQLRDKLRASR